MLLSKCFSFVLLAVMSALLVIGFDWLLPSNAQSVSCGVVQVQTQDQCEAANAFLVVANHAGDPVLTTIAYAAAIDGYALLDWRTGETGGQAILKQDGAWKVVRGVGGAFDSAAMLMRFGVPAKTAQALWTQRSTDLGLAPAP